MANLLGPRDVFRVVQTADPGDPKEKALYTLTLVDGKPVIVLNWGEMQEMLDLLQKAVDGPIPTQTTVVGEVIRENFSFIKVATRGRTFWQRENANPIIIKIRAPMGLCVFRFSVDETKQFADLFREAAARTT